MNTLTNKEKGELIAKACGWSEDKNGWWSHPTLPDNGGAKPEPPDYFWSLDAMHEAEKSERLFGCWLNYEWQVKEIVLRDWRATGEGQIFANSFPIHATAKQRAEAFGITLTLWKP